jgi:hypothetical protein
MAEVRRAGRAVSCLLDYQFWTVKTHVYNVCTPFQKECARTVMFVGARLYSRSGPGTAAAVQIVDAQRVALYCQADYNSWLQGMWRWVGETRFEQVGGKTVPAAAACGSSLLQPGQQQQQQQHLPPLPDELWIEVLGWLRRSELGLL